MTPSVKCSLLALLVCVVLLSYAAEAAPLVENGTVDPGAIPGGLPMSVNDSVRVQIKVFSHTAQRAYFGLCGNRSCSCVEVSGYEKGLLGYSTWWGYTNSIGPWGSTSAYSVAECVGPRTFDKGVFPNSFMVSLRADDDFGVLVVSVEGDENASTSIPLKAGERELKIYSNAGYVLLPDKQWQSKGLRTDGHLMEIGDEVALHLCTTGAAELRVGLCGEARCSVVVVYGFYEDGQLLYGTAKTSWTNQLTAISEWDINPNASGSSFVAGEHHTFVLARVSDKEMQFWLEDDPEGVVSVELDKDSAVLKEFASYGNVILRATDDESFSCPAAAPNTTLPTEVPGDAPTPEPTSPPTASGASSVVSESNVTALFAASLLYMATVR